MITFNQEEFLREHIPYRIQQLESGKHAVMLLSRLGHTEKIAVHFGSGHEMQAKIAALTNAWLEIGLMACRNMVDFLKGKRPRKKDAAIDLFTNRDGRPLTPLSDDDITVCGPPHHTLETRREAVAQCYTAAAKAVAHFTYHDVRRSDDLFLYGIGIETILEASLVSVYDALGLERPKPSIHFIKRSDAHGLAAPGIV